MTTIRNINLSSSSFSLSILTIALVLISRDVSGVSGATFTFVNKCDYTVWPGILANAGGPVLDSTGFELPKNKALSFQAPTGWSGRFWGRTGCKFSGSGSGSWSMSGSCNTGDCGSGQVTCNGNGAALPVTLAEITLGSGGGQDFYDVSLVDGYNLPLIMEASGGSGGSGGGACESAGCVTDLNEQCPTELRVENGGEGCKSACAAFGRPEYCCSGAYGSPATCKPTAYSNVFKTACPTSYSYAYDDATSTFTCTGADYTITFCPSTPSQKSSRDTTPASTTTPNQSSQGFSGVGNGTLPGTGMGGESGASSNLGSGSDEVMVDESWLAGLAMGGSTRTLPRIALLFTALLSVILCFVYS